MGKGGVGKQGKAGKAAVRTPVNGPRQMGTILEWKDTHGFIKPLKPIAHPKHRQDGKVYLAAEDVKEELDGVGCKVSFTLFTDAKGLGAADCRMSRGAAAPVKQVTKAPATKQVVATWGKGKVQQTAFQKKGKGAVAQTAFQKQGKGTVAQTGGKGSTGKAGKDASKNRQIIHNKPLIGTVKQWRGKFGWVTPKDTIDHPKAKNHQGDLFLGQADVEAEIQGVGSLVKFMLYEDDHGLGAANVKPAR